MECPICFKLIQNSCIGSCTHHFCYVCLCEWLKKGGESCPICKENICDVRFDREFDNVNNPNDIKVHITLNKTISILFNDLSPGITIKNFKGIGVQVCALKDNEQCFMSGIRIGDIIVRINRIPSIEHSKAIKIINDCFNYKKKIDFEILI